MYLLRLITTTKDSTTSGIFTYASNGSIFKKILHENMNDKSYIGFNYTKLIYTTLTTHNAAVYANKPTMIDRMEYKDCQVKHLFGLNQLGNIFTK